MCWGPSWVPWYMPDHGTSTAAMIVGGKSVDPGFAKTIAGMVPAGVAELIPIRVVANRPMIEPWDEHRVVKAIDWAVRQGRCSVISISIADPRWTLAIESAVRRAARAGLSSVRPPAKGGQLPIWPAMTALDGWRVCCGGSTVDHHPFPDSFGRSSRTDT